MDVLALWFALVTQDPSAPAVASIDPLADAHAALAAEDPGCEKRALEALQSGALVEAQVAEAWTLRARCYLLAGDADRAERSFAAALRVQPTLALADTPPADAWTRAKSAAPAAGIVWSATSQPLAGALVVSLELTADDLQLAKGVAVFDGETEVARVPLEVGHAKHSAGGLDVPAGALEARLLDRYGNVMARAAVTPATPALAAAAERDARPTGPASGPTVLTYVGAGLLGVGVVGMTASSVGVAVVGGDDVLTNAPLLVAALFGGGGAFLVGAALVVVDQGVAP